jgi:hypothetical protein
MDGEKRPEALDHVRRKTRADELGKIGVRAVHGNLHSVTATHARDGL